MILNMLYKYYELICNNDFKILFFNFISKKKSHVIIVRRVACYCSHSVCGRAADARLSKTQLPPPALSYFWLILLLFSFTPVYLQ